MSFHISHLSFFILTEWFQDYQFKEHRAECSMRNELGEMEYFRKKTRAQGFTLLEVLVAVAILAIAMVAILKANVQSLDTLTRSREKFHSISPG